MYYVIFFSHIKFIVSVFKGSEIVSYCLVEGRRMGGWRRAVNGFFVLYIMYKEDDGNSSLLLLL